MIKAQDLRIGNYLRCNDIEMSSYFIVNKIDISIISDFIEPIQLSEEILLKCGFSITESILHENTNAYEIKSWGRIVLINGILQSDEFYLLDGLSTEIKYLHQLQNLYFALTNEELTIQL